MRGRLGGSCTLALIFDKSCKYAISRLMFGDSISILCCEFQDPIPNGQV